MKKTDEQATVEDVKMVNVGTQTEDVKSTDVSTQADLLQPSMNEAGVQTDTPTNPYPVQSGSANPSVVKISSVTDDSANDRENQFILCEGNNDEKFFPLVVKHNGLFKDSTGVQSIIN